jgi:pyruvate dehydrogenase E1 component alpha subunit
MLLLRHAEEIIAEHYKRGEIRTPVHFGNGQEAVAVGVCQALDKKDVVFSHHRSHNAYLAKGGNLYRMLAELYGRQTGCSHGRGGSVHLTDKDAGVVATSAILGQIVPVAVGAALSFKMDKKQNIAAVFFGDGAFGEGALYESLNFAALKRLNVVFVCENNAYSTETKFDDHIAGGSLVKKAEAFGIKSFQVDGNDVQKVFDLTKELVSLCKKDGGPFFIEALTYRWKEHCGPYYDYELGRTFRSKEDVETWFEKCPLKRQAKTIIENGYASHEDLQKVTEGIKEKIHSTLKRAQQDPWPIAQEIGHNIY